MKSGARAGRAFTLLEALLVIGIVILVTAILTPVFRSSYRAGQISKSVSSLRQLSTALAIYRNDYEGIDPAYARSHLDYFTIGLPEKHLIEFHNAHEVLGVPISVWESPCGNNAEAQQYGPGFVPGLIPMVLLFYHPSSETGTSNPLYRDYLAEYRQNAVAFADIHCNEPVTRFTSEWTVKRALCVTLDGQLINRLKKGNAHYLWFYSDPPD